MEIQEWLEYVEHTYGSGLIEKIKPLCGMPFNSCYVERYDLTKPCSNKYTFNGYGIIGVETIWQGKPVIALITGSILVFDAIHTEDGWLVNGDEEFSVWELLEDLGIR